MITLVAKFYVKKGRGREVEAALKAMTPLVRDLEPGCHAYEPQRAVDDEDIFLVYEQYSDEAALQEHRNTAHFKALIEGVVVPLLEKRERDVYSPLS
ncbi:MAG: antibiotic biosynthesis monooxygenase [Chloroflexota bacterium]|nr:antibiotic biosynthesis monooxygenase [Chloroflexota bacterium]